KPEYILNIRHIDWPAVYHAWAEFELSSCSKCTPVKYIGRLSLHHFKRIQCHCPIGVNCKACMHPSLYSRRCGVCGVLWNNGNDRQHLCIDRPGSRVWLLLSMQHL